MHASMLFMLFTTQVRTNAPILVIYIFSLYLFPSLSFFLCVVVVKL
jgi:hypothetical protein